MLCVNIFNSPLQLYFFYKFIPKHLSTFTEPRFCFNGFYRTLVRIRRGCFYCTQMYCNKYLYLPVASFFMCSYESLITRLAIKEQLRM